MHNRCKKIDLKFLSVCEKCQKTADRRGWLFWLTLYICKWNAQYTQHTILNILGWIWLKYLLDANVSVVGVKRLWFGKPLQCSCNTSDVLNVKTDIEERIKRVWLGVTLKAGNCNTLPNQNTQRLRKKTRPTFQSATTLFCLHQYV